MSVRRPLGATPESGAFEFSATALPARGVSTRVRTGQVAVGGLLLSALIIALGAAGTDSLLPETVRPIPSGLAGPLGQAGFGLGVAALTVLLAMMFACYAVVAASAHRLSTRTVLMTIAAFNLLVLLAPPLLSTDIFSYQAYARLGSMYGVNPYLQGPHALFGDAVYPYIGSKWVTIPTAYGPVFTALSYLLAPLSIAGSVLAYKAIAAISCLALVWFVWNAARLRGLDPVKAAALVGLNPLVVVYGVGGGHNDLLMLAAVAAGIYLLLAHRDRAAGGAMALAIGIKLTAALPMAFAVAGGGDRRTPQRRRDIVLGGAVVAACLTALGLEMFGTGPLHMLATLQKGQSEGDWHSIPGFIASRLGTSAGHIAGLLLASVFVVALVWLLRRVWRGEMDWIDGAGWACAALLVTASALLPWYFAWLIPLAALASDRRLWWTAIVMTGVVQAIQMIGYLPHGVSLLGS